MKNNKIFYLVTFEACWADEFDVKGFELMTETQCKKYKEVIKKLTNSFELSFGGNDGIEFKNGKDLDSSLTYKKITEDEHKLIKKMKIPSFFFPDLDDLQDELEQQTQDEDEED